MHVGIFLTFSSFINQNVKICCQNLNDFFPNGFTIALLFSLSNSHLPTQNFSGFDEILVPHRIRAVLGLHAISEYKSKDTPKTDDDNAYEINFRNVVVHPKYKCKHPDNDIGTV